MKKIQKKTITIGIPAHNEEKNIARLLSDLVKQKGNNFRIESILVVCDGCTDKTVEIAKTYSAKYPIITVRNDGKRLGKNVRLNYLYKHITSDIFIAFDADIQLGSRQVVAELVKQFKNDKIGLVGGRVFPLPQKTQIGKILVAQEYFWSQVINNINNGNNLHSHTGPISAGTKHFLTQVTIPANLPDDHYLYFKAIENGFSYKSAKNAYGYINVPTSFTDYMKQSTRFLNSAKAIKSYFGNWVNKEYQISYSTKLQAYSKTLIKYPGYLSLAIGLVTLQKLTGFKFKEKNTKGIWTQIQSSK